MRGRRPHISAEVNSSDDKFRPDYEGTTTILVANYGNQIITEFRPDYEGTTTRERQPLSPCSFSSDPTMRGRRPNLDLKTSLLNHLFRPDYEGTTTMPFASKPSGNFSGSDPTMRGRRPKSLNENLSE